MNRSGFNTQRLRRPNLIIGTILVGAVLLLVVIGFFWTPYDPNTISVSTRLSGPGEAGHLLGSDRYGRDVLSRLMVGGRSAVFIASVASISALTLGTLFGGIAALKGGALDEAIMRGAEVLYAFPAAIMAIVIAAWMGAGLASTIVAIVAVFTPTTARIVRGAGRAIMGRDWVLAARAYGRKRAWIFFRQGIPNISAVIIVQGTLMFAVAILIEASLAYLGLGVQPPTPSWGGMLRDAQEFMDVQVMLAIIPGLAIVMTVLGVNLIGDGLRDVLDPKMVREL